MDTPGREGLSESTPAIVGKRRRATSYRLIIPTGPGKPALTLPADDPSGALILAQRHGKGRKVELWRDDKLVARISENPFAGFWEIA